MLFFKKYSNFAVLLERQEYLQGKTKTNLSIKDNFVFYKSRCLELFCASSLSVYRKQVPNVCELRKIL